MRENAAKVAKVSDALPTMDDLRLMSAELDKIDDVLSRLDDDPDAIESLDLDATPAEPRPEAPELRPEAAELQPEAPEPIDPQAPSSFASR